MEAQNELYCILRSFRDPNPASHITSVSGLLTAQTNLDPFQVVKGMKGLVREEPWNVRYILRIIPIEITLFAARVDQIKEAVTRLSAKMQSLETFRITVERRNTSMTSSELISNIASAFNNSVNLKNPHWSVLVELIGEIVGVSILRPDDIFSLARESRKEP